MGLSHNTIIFIAKTYTLQGTEERNHDLVQVYKTYFERHVNPTNLALFIDSYIRRTDLNIVREMEPSRRKDTNTLNMPVMNITGALSPHVEDTVTLNGRLDPTNSTWMKVRIFADYIILLQFVVIIRFTHNFPHVKLIALELIYLYFPPSSHLIYVCFCPVGLSLL